MNTIPAQHQTDTSKAPGQVVTPIPEQFLHQYIERKTESRGELGGYAPKPKLTFDEWVEDHQDSIACDDVMYVLRNCWNAAQQNV